MTQGIMDRARQVWPGLMICVVVGLAASFLSDHYGGPVMLFALLLGMTLHFLHENDRVRPGIDFCGRTVLRLGVGLLGLRLTFEDVATFGWLPPLLVLAGIAVTMGGGTLIGRLLGQSRAFSVLSAGAVAICGASAALAIAAVLPRSETNERNTLYVVLAVTSLSTLAMILYPLITAALGFGDTAAGVFIGATVHDVAQVVGAGYAISTEAGDVATFTKLLRVAMLFPIVVAIGMLVRRQGGADATGGGAILPWFLVLFALLMGVSSFGVLPDVVREPLVGLSRFCLVTAIAAIGMKTALKDMALLGPKPIAMMVGQTLLLAVFVLAVLLVI